MKKLLTFLLILSVCGLAYADGLDANTKLLLHLNGTDGATSTTDASDSNHSITFNGTAQLDTAAKKFGTASLLLDGDSDYLSTPDSSDWDIMGSTTDDWTIDLWVKHDDHSGVETYICQADSGGGYWYLFNHDGSGLRFDVNGSGPSFSGTEISDTSWHHVAVCKVGNEWGLYKDGSQIAYDTFDSTNTNFDKQLAIGRQDDSGVYYFDGHLDEVRIQNSNYFSASPVVGLTDTITVPTGEYSVPTVGQIMRLQLN